MRFIGDIHGSTAAYQAAIAGADRSVQVGDFGVGFFKPLTPMAAEGHRFIRGNHDDPEGCAGHPNWIGDGTVEQIGSQTVMFVGGAYSIDRSMRVEGVSWWPDEEISYYRLCELIDQYAAIRPSMMVTHDCPALAAAGLQLMHGCYPSRTQEAFSNMFEIHRPSLWIFGHYHRSTEAVILGTQFRCMGINETCDLEIE